MTQETRICVLGGGGFLGSHLVKALLTRTENQIEAVDISLAKLDVESKRLTKTEASIESAEIIRRVSAEFDVVVSTTALCNPSLYNTRPLDVIHANFTDILPLVENCARHHTRLVHFSTCEVYGVGERDETGRALPMSEDTSRLVVGPISKERWSYSAAKQLLERVIWGYGTHHGLAFTIVRPFNVIGPRMDFLPGIDGEGIPRVLACFIRALMFDEPLALVDGGTARRSFIHVDEFVEAVVRIIERPDSCNGQIINVGNPDNDVTMRELAEQMAATFSSHFGRGRAIHIESVPAVEFYGQGYEDVAERIADIAKARRLLDWEPFVPLSEMLPEIIADYISRYGEQAAAQNQDGRSPA